MNTKYFIKHLTQSNKSSHHVQCLISPWCFESIYILFMHSNQINFCIVLLLKAQKHFQKMAENGVNHINEKTKKKKKKGKT
jgi:hypothetical protein